MFDITTVTILLIVIMSILIYIEYRLSNKPRINKEERYRSNRLNTSALHKKKDDADKTDDEIKKDNLDLEETISEIKEPKKDIDTLQPEVKKNIVTPLPEAEAEKEVMPPIELPKADYPKFNHSRLIEMGLSEDDVKELMAELIMQVETELPLMQKAIDSEDIFTLSEKIHYIKGSTTNLGTGGISNLLVDFHQYIRKESNTEIVQAYFDHLKRYFSEMKEQY